MKLTKTILLLAVLFAGSISAYSVDFFDDIARIGKSQLSNSHQEQRRHTPTATGWRYT
jgi:hypothetical protein